MNRLFSLIAILLLFPQVTHAFSYTDSYVPPEALHSDTLSGRVTLPRKVNVNQASLSELVSLPGFDENIALKLMRIRPVENIQDFYRLPYMKKQDIERLINDTQKRIDF